MKIREDIHNDTLFTGANDTGDKLSPASLFPAKNDTGGYAFPRILSLP
jgi:hypothetical protein